MPDALSLEDASATIVALRAALALLHDQQLSEHQFVLLAAKIID